MLCVLRTCETTYECRVLPPASVLYLCQAAPQAWYKVHDMQDARELVASGVLILYIQTLALLVRLSPPLPPPRPIR